MILDALIAQFQQRFQHEKRAQVCLMYPQPFELLAYDPAVYHGQIWLKYRVYSDLAALGLEERTRRRYVFYLPLSEDCLDTPDDAGMHYLELLAEYRLTGVLWRLGGKRPTLFSFLRHAGVKLPDNPSEQRRLYDGGRNSLLAKYVANSQIACHHWRCISTTCNSCSAGCGTLRVDQRGIAGLQR